VKINDTDRDAKAEKAIDDENARKSAFKNDSTTWLPVVKCGTCFQLCNDRIYLVLHRWCHTSLADPETRDTR
jgi:hypothetical protein